MENRKKKYKIVKRGAFQSMQKFEDLLNDYAKQGWEVVNLTSSDSSMHALIEKPN